MKGDVHDRQRVTDMLRLAKDAVWADCEAHLEVRGIARVRSRALARVLIARAVRGEQKEEFARLALAATDNKDVPPWLWQLVRNRSAYLDALRDGSRTARCSAMRMTPTGRLRALMLVRT